MLETPGYPIKKVERLPQEIEQEPNVPIIDFVRHGETKYKQRASHNKENLLDTSAPGFALDSEHLDLTAQGIQAIRGAANQLPIDPEKEAVLILSSPDWRAHSSGLVLDDELRKRFGEKGENVILNTKDPKTGLTQFHFFTEIGSTDTQLGILEKRALSEEIGGDRFENLAPRNFQRFLRHMNNIDNWITPETKARIKGKKLRIICMTHEEVTLDFVIDTLGGQPGYERKTLEKAQVLEIKPSAKLKVEGSVLTSVVAYPTKSRPKKAEVVVERGFSPVAKKAIEEQAKADAQEKEKRKKPAFALDKWNYENGGFRVFQLIESLVVREREKDRLKGDNRADDLRGRLEEAYASGGGKAFGLVVSECIAKNFGAMPYQLQVPKWEVIRDVNEVNPNDHKDSILRTSDREEDWIDPRSGVGESFNFSDFQGRGYFLDVKKKKKLSAEPFVLQKVKAGYGLVVDIGHSPTLGKLIVRIASGNYRRDYILGQMASFVGGEFTSATDDVESSVGVWEAHNGHPVLPTASFGHPSLFKDEQSFMNTLVQPLFEAVQKTGIDFGVQLELIVHPSEPFTISLVQTRPSPQKMYQSIPVGGTEKKRQKEELVASSARVNGAFDVTGEVITFGDNEVLWGLGYDTSSRGQEMESIEKIGRGKIGIWGRGSINEARSRAASSYLGAYIQGSDVELTPKAIRPNSHHGAMSYANHEDVSRYDFLDKNCGMVSLGEEQIEKLWQLAKKGPIKLRVASDGLIAQVYLIED